jgi:hypothetical protein
MGILEHYFPGKYTYEQTAPSEWRHVRKPFVLVAHRTLARMKCRKVGFVRDPYDRFESLLRHQRDGKVGLPKSLRGNTSRALMQYTRRQLVVVRPNPHVLPQESFLYPATELIPFEGIQAWWEDEFGFTLPYVNAAESEAVLSAEDRAFVETYYRADLALYESASGMTDRSA